MLEAHRHLDESAPDRGRHPVDEAGGDQGLADGGVGGPAGPVGEEVLDGHGQEVVGVHQPAVGGDDAVAVGVGVVPGGDVVGGLALGVGRHRRAQRGHGVGGGAVHADLAVPVQGHEVPGRVHLGIDHRELQAVALTDRTPVVHRGAAQRVGPDAHAGLADRLEVDDALQVGDVGLQVVVLDDVGAVEGLSDRDPRDVLPPGGEQLVGAVGDPRGGL